MKVSELITKLSSLPQDMDVVTKAYSRDDDEYHVDIDCVEVVQELDTYGVETQQKVVEIG